MSCAEIEAMRCFLETLSAMRSDEFKRGAIRIPSELATAVCEDIARFEGSTRVLVGTVWLCDSVR